ncbi:ATP-binding cassette sub-family B member 8, mitochondrial [Lingula anatina]|uniref:ATP-binding cassette sub-family B member 8, mitochondrial n=1 Tax=Lingula anatina TaxID=7574 RepID=A0A1S3KF87_LINAN|nr:ATP-binding cassette sub-family B member 8, mitochondrial [Lingula anatina]|eukprot:XP_013421119.1 ATP-binding cassette sub-family B member 8, mitochondrial [Lingula anatina]
MAISMYLSRVCLTKNYLSRLTQQGRKTRELFTDKFQPRNRFQSHFWFKQKTQTSQPLNKGFPAYGLKFGFGIAGGLILICCKSQHALCEPKRKKNSRLIETKDEDQGPDPNFNWKEFIKVLLPEIWYLIAAIVSAFAVAVVNIQIPMMLGELVNVVAEFTKDANVDYFSEIRQPAIKLISMYGLQAAMTTGYIALLSTVGERVACRMRKELFQSLIRQDIVFFDAHKTGELINRLTSDVQDFKSSFKLCISQGLRSATQTIGCIVSLYLLSPKLTLLMVVVVPSLVAGGALIGSGLRKLSKAAQAQIAQATSVADEALGNARTVRAFAMEPKEIELFNKEADQAMYMNENLGYGIGVFQGLANLALNGIVLGVMYAGGYLMATHELSPGDLMSFLVATQTIQRSLAQMSLLFGSAVRGVSAGARVFEYTSLKPEIPLTGGQCIPYYAMYGNIEFKNVSFSYPTRPEQEVLHNFSLKIPAGKVVALCGLSGGGKSTIAALLERFYDVKNGSITVDDVDIKDLDPSWLRGRAIGFINQRKFIPNVKEMRTRFSYLSLRWPNSKEERYIRILSRTVLVIAHRLSTIQNADIIAVVANGRIAELGDHLTLKRKRGLYWELIKQQQIEDEVHEQNTKYREQQG